MSTPQEIQERINHILLQYTQVNAQLDLLYAVRNNLAHELLCATDEHRKALADEAIANEKAAAVEAAEAIVGGVSE